MFKTLRNIITLVALAVLTAGGNNCAYAHANGASIYFEASIVKKEVKSVISKPLCKTRRFTTGNLLTKPFICIDREVGYVYTSWRTLQESNDNTFNYKKSRYYKKGIPGKRIIIDVSRCFVKDLTHRSPLHTRVPELIRHQIFKDSPTILYCLHARADAADTIFNI